MTSQASILNQSPGLSPIVTAPSAPGDGRRNPEFKYAAFTGTFPFANNLQNMEGQPGNLMKAAGHGLLRADMLSRQERTLH